ncbi:transglutaminase superfamily protein [Arenibacter algicola]|uniref:Transglutaminase superfamily protein n=1 Tax=Arenibacter algicola TaxID=616991 RepID=A0ABY3ABD4_9FLAO
MKKLLLIYLALNIQFLMGQDYDFGKVSKEELSEKFNSTDSSATASYLYKYRKSFFEYIQNDGFQLVTEIHERVKIYNKDGFDYATKKINLFKDGGNSEKISELKAFTFNLVNDKIEESKLKSDGEFDIELSKFYDQKSFTMPNVKEGSIIEYKYKVRSPFIAVVDEFKFQHDIPVKKLLAIFDVPEYFNYNVNVKGFLPVVPKIENSTQDITFNNKTRSGGFNYTSSQTTFNTSKISYIKNRSLYEMTDVPALKSEPYVNNIDNYRSSVKYELSYTKFPNAMIKYYSTTWEDVVKTIYESSNFGSELNKTGYFEKDLEALLVDISDPLEKISKIFSFVKSQVKWNGYYGKYTDNGVRQAYKEHSGNVAEVNLMLTAMLRSIGLNANPVLVSTRDNGIPVFPTRDGYNYVIAGVEVHSEIVLLDATSFYSTLNILPLRVLNWEGRMIKKDGSSVLVNLYPKNAALESVYLNVELFDEGDMSGELRNVKTGHDGMYYRTEYNGGNEDEFIEKLENKHGGMEISDFEVTNSKDLTQPIRESYKFIQDSQVEIIGDRMYFSPLFFLSTKENPFKLEKREFPVDFGYPSENKYRIGITIPEGYVIETLPKSAFLRLPDDLGSFMFNITTTANQIQLVVNSKMEESIISPVYYETLKEYFKLMIAKTNEKIVLTKNLK